MKQIITTTNKSLLPNWVRLPGLVLVLLGLAILTMRYGFNYKPGFLDLKVYALYSFYIETKTFTVISNQMIEEFGGLFLLLGLFLLALSREKSEVAFLDVLRIRAFVLSSWINLIFLYISVLFFYGFGFVGALTLFPVIWLVAYLLVFRYLVFKSNIVEKEPIG